MDPKKTAASPSASSGQRRYADLGYPLHHPRLPIGEIKKCMSHAAEPDIFLRELREHIEIVIRLPKPTDFLPIGMREELGQLGVTLPKAFEANLWEKLGASKSTIWAALAVPASESYRQLWHSFFKMVYLGQFHPALEHGLKLIEGQIASAGDTKHKRGRPSAPKAEVESIQRRYKELLPACVLIHAAAELAVSSAKTKSQIRRHIFERTRRSIHGVPFVYRIFSGDAFSERSYGSKHAKLEDPKSWAPHHLAISLLTFERSQAHETIEKKLRRRGGNTLASSSKRI